MWLSSGQWDIKRTTTWKSPEISLRDNWDCALCFFSPAFSTLLLGLWNVEWNSVLEHDVKSHTLVTVKSKSVSSPGCQWQRIPHTRLLCGRKNEFLCCLSHCFSDLSSERSNPNKYVLLFFQLYFDAVKINKINIQVKCYCISNIFNSICIFLISRNNSCCSFSGDFWC